MKAVKWGAVVLETLNVLMALGSVPSSTEPPWLRIGAGIAAVLGIVVVLGLVRHTKWGAPGGVGAGLLSVVGGIAMIVTDESGGGIGLAVGVLVTLLCALSLRTAAGRRGGTQIAHSASDTGPTPAAPPSVPPL